MLLALQASHTSPRVASNSCPRRPVMNWNRPEVQVRFDGNNLVEMYSALVSTLLPPQDRFPLNKPSEIPEAVAFHTSIANRHRENADVDAYFRHAQAAGLLKKVEFPLFEEVCRQNALEKWLAADEACGEMNEKCYDILVHSHTTKHTELKRLLVEIRAEILALIGEEPPDEEHLAKGYGFGPGADSTHARNEGHSAYKQLCHSCMTEDELETLAHTAPLVLSTGGNPLLAALGIQQSVSASYEAATLAFVPKNCQEHRIIEILPSLSTMRAQAYDKFFRQRLIAVYGIDLSSQEQNRHLAFLGSLKDTAYSPVTLDLSSASDRISMGLIRLIFPVAWSKALFGLRAKTVLMPDGTSRVLEKFASMGNSITFSLQTAIYSAIIVRAYRDAGLKWKKWRAYGDDIVVVKSVAPRVMADLELCGFKLNWDKSFVSGPFRESCGNDYLAGHNVRPFFFKKPVRTVVDVYKYLNVIQIIAARAPIPAHAYRGLYSYLLALVPDEFFVLGHPAFGLETCIWSPCGVVPKRILRERVVSTVVPEFLAYRVALLIGAGESRIIQKAKVGELSNLSLVKERTFFTPSQLLEYKRARTLEEGGRKFTSEPLRTTRSAPTGQTAIVIRRPGRPGFSPLGDDEIKRLMDPFLIRILSKGM